jgi:ATP/maltotriose-dependent transcriptional regulator MalT
LTLSKLPSMAKTAGEYKAVRRRRAVADGFCLTCCVNVPIEHRRVCATCSERATARSARRRLEVRKKRELSQDVAIPESLGDQHYLDGNHRAASEAYERALLTSADERTARSRLSAKLARSTFILGIGTGSDDWFNVPLELTEAGSDDDRNVEKLFSQHVSMLLFTFRTSEVIALSKRVIRFATKAGHDGLLRASRLSLATGFFMVSSTSEARRQLDAIVIDGVSKDDDHFYTNYYRVYGLVHSSFGEADESFANFSKALEHADRLGDGFKLTTVYSNQGHCANTLGRIEIAAASFREALAVARRHNFVWLVPYLCLEYARILSRQGSRHLAHAYVNEAVVYGSPSHVLIEGLAEIGIPIALECEDRLLADKCANEDALHVALRTGEPLRAGPVAASFARYYHERGRPQLAQAALSKALRIVTSGDQSYDLPLAVGELGCARDIPAARELLENRMRLPNAAVAVAHKHLFEALVSRRNGMIAQGVSHARLAAQAFAHLEWISHVSAANRVLQSLTTEGLETVQLSPRERSVADLAIGGCSNRLIAQKLAIAESTVENHMRSIMGRAGVRSRHQLRAAIRP